MTTNNNSLPVEYYYIHNNTNYKYTINDDKTVSLERVKLLLSKIDELEKRLQNQMIICPDCKKEMTCIKMGIGVRYTVDAKHVYYGDKYKCNKCGKEIINTNKLPAHDDKYKKDDIYMDTTYHALIPRPRSLRQMEEDE